MSFRARTDAFGFELPADRSAYLRLAGRTFVLDQLMALPVALAMTSAGMSFGRSYLITSIYSQAIGALCTTLTCLFLPWLDRQRPDRAVAGIVLLYFVAGVAGADVARRLSEILLGVAARPAAPAYISWAIGATMALIVGLVLTLVRHLRSRVVATELEALQARINPHFLFNTLNSIAALIREDPVRAEAMTLRLSSLFRYTLTAPRRGLVTIDDELAIVDGYLAIEQERLGPRLTYTIDVDASLRACRLPPLTLQPLVENAIKHGVAPAVGGGGVRVRGWRDGAQVHLSVIDTGSGTSDAGGTGEGLESVRRRLRATFGAAGSVSLDVVNGSTEAHVTFPAVEHDR